VFVALASSQQPHAEVPQVFFQPDHKQDERDPWRDGSLLLQALGLLGIKRRMHAFTGDGDHFTVKNGPF
jgi:hypothetical protein